ncbi:MAG: hypothetical protein V4619_12630 [Bacteroidota bacterium]
MFKQFTENISAHQGYLLFSLGIFFVFFVVIAVMLYLMPKKHVDAMSDLPLVDSDDTETTNRF